MQKSCIVLIKNFKRFMTKKTNHQEKKIFLLILLTMPL